MAQAVLHHGGPGPAAVVGDQSGLEPLAQVGLDVWAGGNGGYELAGAALLAQLSQDLGIVQLNTRLVWGQKQGFFECGGGFLQPACLHEEQAAVGVKRGGGFADFFQGAELLDLLSREFLGDRQCAGPLTRAC